MTTVDKDWLAKDAPYYVNELDDIAQRLDGAEPTDGSVSGDEYQDARDFINTIEAASEALHDAYIHVVDADDLRDDPTPFRHYKTAHETLSDVAYRDLPDVPGHWRTEFDNAKADLQNTLSNFPKP